MYYLNIEAGFTENTKHVHNYGTLAGYGEAY